MASNTPVPPAQGAPPPSAPPQTVPPKKTNWLLWGLVGCGGLIVLVFIVFSLATAYIWHKIPKTPAQVAAALITANNPDAEVVAVDDSRGLVQVKDRKTGKIITINLEDAKKGKISFTGEGKESFTFDAGQAEKGGLLQVQTDQGTASWGVGAPKNLPAWLPIYPGAKLEAGGSMQGADAAGGEVQFKTADSLEKVVSFYEAELKKVGLNVQIQSGAQDETGAVKVLVGSDEVNKRGATVTIVKEKDNEGTGVMILYQSKK